jgi:hypothetical protein
MPIGWIGLATVPWTLASTVLSTSSGLSKATIAISAAERSSE